MSQITITAIVTGFPPGLRPPKPLPGENMAQLVIRNHPQEWQNCVERLKNDFHVPEDVCARLRSGDTSAATDAVTQREIERFMNLRLPSHGRTLQGLADIREQMSESGGLAALWQLKMSEIIWPRPKHPSGDTEAKKFAASLGVTVISIDTPGDKTSTIRSRGALESCAWGLPLDSSGWQSLVWSNDNHGTDSHPPWLSGKAEAGHV